MELTEDVASLNSKLATLIKERGDIENVVDKLKEAIIWPATNNLKFERIQRKRQSKNRSHAGQRKLPSKGKN